MNPWIQRSAAACMALLAACGPGVGGSGTGQVIEGAGVFGAQTALVCSADFATALDCRPVSTAVDTPTTLPDEAGTQVVRYADSDTAASVVIEFAGNEVELRAPCRSLHFSGVWGTSPAFGARFYGSITQAGQAVLPASLSVRGQGSGTLLSVELDDAAGKPLLGPLTLTRRAQPVPTAGC